MEIDWTVLDFIQKFFRCDFLDFAMPKITMLGNGGFIWILAASILTFTKKYRKCGITLLIGLAIGGILGNLVLKPLIARPRPCWLDPSFELLISNPTDYSFPSGHTMVSVISAIILTISNKRFGFVVVPLAILIIFSRLYLYVHFPTDILGAILLGTIVSIFSKFIVEKLALEPKHFFS